MSHLRLLRKSRFSRLITIATLLIASLASATHASAQTLATLIAPANGATNVDPGAAFSWNGVANAQLYYIYVGSSVGLKNVYDSGSISPAITTKTVPGLQANTTYYVRLWTELNGIWGSNYRDTTFTTGVGIAHLTFPLNGATNIDQYAPFTWNAVPNTLSYTLNIGSQPGLSDIFNTGPITATSTFVPGLQGNTTYYARLFTQSSGGSNFADSVFTSGTGLAHLISPANGAVGVVPGATFTWNSVSNVQVYYIYVGTTVGAKNTYDSGALTVTSRVVPNLAGNTLYYVRLWTEKGNIWYYVDSTFTTASSAFTPAKLTFPLNGATSIDPFVTLTWNSIAGATSYGVSVGTTSGGSDVFTTSVGTTSVFVPNLQGNRVYYVHLVTNTSSGSNFSDSSFTTGTGIAHLTNPLQGAASVDPFGAFTWTSVSDAQAYYLYVGTTSGGTDIIYAQFPQTVTSTLVPGMIGGQTYYARMYTKKNGVWSATTVNTFQTAVQSLPPDANAFRANVQSQTAAVRMMTQGLNNTPIPGTPLALEVIASGHSSAFCTDYARTLVQQFMGQRISSRVRDVLFDGAIYETHETTEYYDPFLSQWVITDATFGVTYWNSSTSTGLSVQQLSGIVAAKNWTAIPVIYLTTYVDAVLKGYYMDPILNYLNPLPVGVFSTQGPVANSPVSFMTNVTGTAVGKAGTYIFSFVNQTDSVTISDPRRGTVVVTPSNGTPFAGSTQLNTNWTLTSSPSGLIIYTINRYLF